MDLTGKTQDPNRGKGKPIAGRRSYTDILKNRTI